jgi:hypothetical protein
MKKILITCMFLVSFSFVAFSQQTTITVPKYKIDTVTKKITYTEVVDQQGIKDTLYNRAIHWCGIYFKNLLSVKTQDKLNGKIGGEYKFKIFDKRNKDSIPVEMATILFKYTIDLKENKYRYTVTDFTLKDSNPVFYIERWLDKNDKAYKADWDYFFAQLDKDVQGFIKSLKKGMQEVVKVSDDW